MPTVSLLDEFDRPPAAVTSIVGAVRPDQLGPPTAPAVRAVIGHLVTGNVEPVAWARGSPPGVCVGVVGRESGYARW